MLMEVNAMLMKLLPGACVALALIACASHAPRESTKTANANEPPIGCVYDTATRIPVNPKNCPAFGNTFTKDQINSTGKVEVGQALQMLDTSVTTHH
jgi:hypothetical protein